MTDNGYCWTGDVAALLGVEEIRVRMLLARSRKRVRAGLPLRVFDIPLPEMARREITRDGKNGPSTWVIDAPRWPLAVIEAYARRRHDPVLVAAAQREASARPRDPATNRFLAAS